MIAVRRYLALSLMVLGLTWAGWFLRLRQELRLENHLLRNLALPFPMRGRPALHPDGRVFLCTVNHELLALGADGTTLWNKALPGPVNSQPVLVSARLLVLQGQGLLYGYSLGGELRFSEGDGGDLEDLPAADGHGNLYLLDRQGALVGLGPDGRTRFRTSLGLVRERQAMVLPGGQVLGAGADAAGHAQAFLAQPGGAVGVRVPLPAMPVGLSVSAHGDEAAALSCGREVLTLDPKGTPLRRVALPAPARSAPLALADGAIYVLVGAEETGLCRFGAAGERSFCIGTGVSGPGPGPVLGRDGRVYAAFLSAHRLFPSYRGVLAVGADGSRYRQPLPEAPLGLTLSWGGGALCGALGERYLWLLEGGSESDHAPYHPWPMPLGNPAASSRPWPHKGI